MSPVQPLDNASGDTRVGGQPKTEAEWRLTSAQNRNAPYKNTWQVRLWCDVVVTDGIRYRMYEAGKNLECVAYAILARLKESSWELFECMKKA